MQAQPPVRLTTSKASFLTLKAHIATFTKETSMTLLLDQTSQQTGLAAAASARDATKIYGAGETVIVALDNVDVDFAAGQFTAIMGPSGSGKSTLMHCMAGLDRLTSGSAFIGDIDIAAASEKQLTLLRRDRLGFVFQAFNLVPTLTALENITLPMDLAGHKPDKKWLDSVVSTVGLADRLNHRPGALSGGQQQRVAVARALASRPEIIFADEPTGNLDSTTGGEILAFMRHAVRQSSWSPTTRSRLLTRTVLCSSPTDVSPINSLTRPPILCSTTCVGSATDPSHTAQKGTQSCYD